VTRQICSFWTAQLTVAENPVTAQIGGYLKSIWDKPWWSGLRMRHVADVKFWARLGTQKRSDKVSIQGRLQRGRSGVVAVR
jgi:hypothetical protein